MIHRWKHYTKNISHSQESQVERSIIWLIVVLLISLHHLVNGNLFVVSYSTSALGKPSFVDWHSMFPNSFIANISQYVMWSLSFSHFGK